MKLIQLIAFANAYFCKWCLCKSSGMFVLSKQVNKQQYTDTCTQNHKTRTHLPVQISPPAVHFSLALWSLFMSPPVPPSKPLSSCSPSATFHASILTFNIAASNISLCDNTLFLQYVITYFIMSLWTKWNIALLSFGTFSSSPVASQKLVYLLSSACNLTVTQNPITF